MTMKAALLFFAFVLGSASASGQDDAAAMAMQQAQQASQQAIQAAQQAMDQATITSQQTAITNLQMQQAAANASSSGCPGPIIGAASQPTFSVKQGKVAAGTVVRIKSATHYAAIYYTTDGWAPTKASTRYTGPITINAKTHIEAIATGPNLLHSSIVRVDYTVDAPATASAPQAPLVTDGVLRAGTALRLVTNSEVSSQTAGVGDKIPLLLDQDVKVGDTVVAAKGTPVDAILTVADPAAKRTVPGDLVFEVHALNVHGVSIPLKGGETLEGEAGRKPKEAIIEPGMVVPVAVAANTSLKP
jgi:hypothetical protein